MTAPSEQEAPIVRHLGRLQRLGRGAGMALVLAACFAILAARRPDALRNPQFWAEDGMFYQQAYSQRSGALFEAYDGYLHLVPRLVATLAVRCNPVRAPAVFTGCAFALTLFVAAMALSSRCPLRPRVACALAIVLVPDAFEVLCNIVNIQWILAAGLLLLLISDDGKKARQRTYDCCVATIFGLTGPFSITVSPLFAWRAWRRRTTSSLVLAIVICACGAIQAYEIHLHHYPLPPGSVAWRSVLAVPGMRVAGSLLAGCLVPANYPFLVETTLGLATLFAVGFLGLRLRSRTKEYAWLALAFGILLASSLWRCRHVLPDLCHAGYGSRYFFPLQLIVVWMMLGAAAARGWRGRAAAMVLVWALAVNLPRLREPALEDFHWRTYALKLQAGESVTIPVNPAGWKFVFPARPH